MLSNEVNEMDMFLGYVRVNNACFVLPFVDTLTICSCSEVDVASRITSYTNPQIICIFQYHILTTLGQANACVCMPPCGWTVCTDSEMV